MNSPTRETQSQHDSLTSSASGLAGNAEGVSRQTIREPGEEPVEHKPALKVWQYEVPRTAYPIKATADGSEPGFTVKMPKGARILTVVRGSMACAVIFAWVNPEMEEEQRYFYIVKTNRGMASPEEAAKAAGWERARLAYVGTWEGYQQWWHLFEVTR